MTSSATANEAVRGRDDARALRDGLPVEPARLLGYEGAVVLREEILELARRHHAQVTPPPFVPGETYVPASGKVLDAEDLVHLIDASLDLWLTAGRFTADFERRLASRLGTRAALLTSSGSAANLLALTVLTSPRLGDRQLEPGSEVITVAAGFPTTVNPIIQNRCIPVFVDVETTTYNVDASQLEAALSPRTRAVMLAHTLGNPFDVERVTGFCQQHDLLLIEDCCDALGSTYRGRHVGRFGEMGTLSFYPAHHITMGEGGAVFFESTQYRRIVQSLRDWGRDCWCKPGKDDTCGKRFEWQLGDLPEGYDHKYVYSHIGYNLKATDMQAAIGCSQLDKVDGFVARRRANHAALTRGFRQSGLDESFQLPEATPNSEPSWFGYLLTVREKSGLDRSRVTKYLEEHKVGTRLLFGGDLTKQPAYRDVQYRVVGELPGTQRALHDSFWIGVWPGLGQTHIDYVLEVFADMVKELRK